MIKLHLFLKRIMDILLSLIALFILSPFMVIIAFLVKKDSPGPILFAQNRLTKNGKIFKMYKFRTMIVGAEQMGSGLFNFAGDPRVTKLGKRLRETSLDELPQFFNVLMGDLSLVGPRPAATYSLGDFETLNKKYKKRFSMLGGITGLAQIKGRNDITWEEKVEFDNQYIDQFQHQGIILDIKILLLTVKKVLFDRGTGEVYEKKADDTMSDGEAAKIAHEEAVRLAHLPDE